jgi:hypothetical protein
MKKLVTLFIVLSILVPAAFAQYEGTFTWGGEVRADYEVLDTTDNLVESLLQLKGTYTKGPISVIGSITEDIEGNFFSSGGVLGAGLDPILAFEFTAVDPNGNYKADVKVANQGFSSFDSILMFTDIKTLYGWAKLFDQQLRVDVSYMGGDVLWNTPGPLGTWGVLDPFDSAGGIRFAYYPSFLKGLNAGVYFPIPRNVNEAASPTTGLKSWLQKGTSIGAKYISPDSDPAEQLTIAAGIKITDTLNAVVAGAKFKISPALYVNGDVQALIVDEKYSFGLGGEYAQAPLTIGGTFKLNDLGNGGKTTANLAIVPYVQYVFVENVLLGKLTVTFTQGLLDNTASTLAINPLIAIGYKGGVSADKYAFTGFQFGYTLTLDFKGADPTNRLYAGFRHAF